MQLEESMPLLELSPLFRVSRSLDTSVAWTITGGQGAEREFFDTEDAGLITWLLSLSGKPFSADQLTEQVMTKLGVDAHTADELVHTLVSAAIFAPQGVVENFVNLGAHWEQEGWRDAFDFHFAVRRTKFDRLYREDYESTLRGYLADTSESGPQPPAYKEVIAPYSVNLDPFTQDGDQPGAISGVSLADTLQKTIPLNIFTQQGLELGDIARMLKFSNGVQHSRELVLGTHLFKPAASGGARHPVEIYLAARDVQGLRPGIYHYHPGANELRLVNDESALKKLDATGFDKGGIRTSSAILFMTYRFIRHSWKYRYSRTYRMVLMELGHVFQTTRLVAAALGLEIYYCPAIDDYLVSDLLKLGDDCEEGPMYALGLGRGGVL